MKFSTLKSFCGDEVFEGVDLTKVMLNTDGEITFFTAVDGVVMIDVMIDNAPKNDNIVDIRGSDKLNIIRSNVRKHLNSWVEIEASRQNLMEKLREVHKELGDVSESDDMFAFEFSIVCGNHLICPVRDDDTQFRTSIRVFKIEEQGQQTLKAFNSKTFYKVLEVLEQDELTIRFTDNKYCIITCGRVTAYVAGKNWEN